MRAGWLCQGGSLGFCFVLLATMASLGAAGQEAPAPPGDRAAVAGARSAYGPDPLADAPEESSPIDINTAIAGMLARWLSTPRFAEEIEVRDRYQEALDAHLQAAELGCQVARSELPRSHVELDRYGANPKSPSADLLTPTKMLGRKLKGLFSGNKSRFFVYSIRAEATPERVVYVVLDDKVPMSLRHSVPGTAWELVAKFDDRDEAADAVARLQRGDPAIPDRESPRVLWAATGCE